MCQFCPYPRRRWANRTAKRSTRRSDSRENAGNAPRAPRTTQPWGGEAAGVHRSRDHRLRLESLAPQFLDDAPRLLGAALVERPSRILHRRGMCPAVPPHGEIEVVRGPAAAGRPDALGIQCCGELGIGSRAARAQVVDEEADARRLESPIGASLRRADGMGGSHGRCRLKASERSAHGIYGHCAPGLRVPKRGRARGPRASRSVGDKVGTARRDSAG
jgi:hypothetical protein